MTTRTSVGLNLRAAFDLTYDRAGYDYAMNYRRPLTSASTGKKAKWIATALHQQVPR